MVTGAVAALVMIMSAGGGARHSLTVTAADAARSRSATAWALGPAGSAAGQVKAEVPVHDLIARAIAADRRKDAREAAAERRAERQAVAAPAPTPTPTPVPVAPPATSAGDFSFGALESLWASAGGPSWAASQAASIALCESGGNPQAYNPSGASGLWQILGQVVPGNIFDPMVNAENAVAKFRASGDTFAQWVC